MIKCFIVVPLKISTTLGRILIPKPTDTRIAFWTKEMGICTSLSNHASIFILNGEFAEKLDDLGQLGDVLAMYGL